ncbi:TetR/AcrR family transcriptional regulator [Rhodopseudomonas pseudopalustris]|uniref:Regulatory protein, TetR n=2 Tax=Rhodopseudomonas TaxID=1073 RepID=Q13DL8_RHOPS|nr:TetR/AcrR family transcriptional regulator [Rhodopseudomonas pseudopalustris]ABE37821.1 regulatory protein, TetR [Rhodopseudomonas palustris BisB5]MBB1091541.1 TetR/AcrR family transcriptional regulator [Rhodopseudomonas palustris]SEP23856.1 transcriptional regulator, TetR family [Rhodopseudomonas pseudopalustris]
MGKRAENSAAIKERLYVAAAEIVAQVGFAGASVARITDKAGIAQGTFYNYFETREAIFEELVPIFGKKLRGHIRSRVGDTFDFYERERIAFDAFFEFLHGNRFFARVLNEAEIFTPAPHHDYFESILKGYRAELARASREGQIRKLSASEVEVISLMLMSARTYFALHYSKQIHESRKVSSTVTNTYMDVVRRALSP